ncbi:MAG: NAD(P)H-dependent oxidoreductase [Pseudomonadota bacterium]|uniref:FMN-dependent NADH-azoreductase n=1 Tax=Pseudomonas sp. TaxID=306 RepID=UPI00272CED41|nr:NAD(P)H-dependent oxidoreductase [Pseudomonas sp.]MDQ3599527.1 NAD(P)H-dependent oxidoreductase [Pseudomonadota bacterium]
MKELLMINSSPNGPSSPAYQLAVEMVDGLHQSHPGIIITSRDLVAEPLTPISDVYAKAMLEGHSADVPAFEQSERLIAELERSDALLIITPIHNFTLPAALKLWIDNVVRARRTFGRGPNGKVGLLRDRPTYILISSGGVHRGPEANQPDFITIIMRCVLNTIGLQDLHFIYLQGMAFGPHAVLAAMEDARRQIKDVPLFFTSEAMSDE